jgi:large subunit ribosomal protein L9
LRATKDNRAKFDAMKTELQAKNEEQKADAGQLAANFEGKSLVMLRQAAETGQLYGSVSPRDIAEMLSAQGTPISRAQVVLNAAIKLIGQYQVPIALHPEVEVIVLVNVARNEEEAERLMKGENVTVRRHDDDDDEEEAQRAAAAKAAEAVFEDESAEAETDETDAGETDAGTAPDETEQ